METLKKLSLLVLSATAFVLIASVGTGCASVKPVIASIDEIAQTLCAKHHQETMGLSLDDAAEFYCKTREAYEPWIDAALSSVKVGAAAKAGAGASQCPDTAPATTAAPAATPVSPAAPALPATPGGG
jgi:hypothetical protein